MEIWKWMYMDGACASGMAAAEFKHYSTQLQNNLKSPEACNLATPMHERAHRLAMSQLQRAAGLHFWIFFWQARRAQAI